VISAGEAQLLLNDWGAKEILDNPEDRFSSALSDVDVEKRQGHSDLAVLIRQILRTDDERRRKDVNREVNPKRLQLPSGLFPEDFNWGDFGLVSEGDKVRANPWRPQGLSLGDVDAVDTAVSIPEERRSPDNANQKEDEYPFDPFVKEIHPGVKTYRTQGQRSAVRSARILEPGDTLIVNLPTGSGKTTALLAAALSDATKLSIIVVPTVSLAVDQERRLREVDPQFPPTAYYGGLSQDEKNSFRRRIEEGRQPVVFTNPEALFTGLATSVTAAAKGGNLNLFAIDEAHIVAAWGDSFRPHFHALAGFRKHLLREATKGGHEAFSTILASATITDEVLLLLKDLFDGDENGRFLSVSAPLVRPEPSIWTSLNMTASERDDLLLEAIQNLPRPAIVYTTLKEKDEPGTLTPKKIKEILEEKGFKRIAVVDGGSSSKAREKVLKEIRDEPSSPAKVDLVVATSAFGLGIDVPDVRVIIHACFPESLHRFYQESGRGGRDGLATVSLVLATKEDKKLAKRMSNPGYLTNEVARKRWVAMWTNKQAVPGSKKLFEIKLGTLSKGIDENSPFNEKWNLSTLALMVRTRQISWDFSLNRENGTRRKKPVAKYENTVLVRLIGGNHNSDDFWDNKVTDTKKKLVNIAYKDFQMLEELLKGQKCAGEIIASQYTLESTNHEVMCVPSCGGCPFCRKKNEPPFAGYSPFAPAIEVRGEAQRVDGYAKMGQFGKRVIVRTPKPFKDASNNELSAWVVLLLRKTKCKLLVMPDSLGERIKVPTGIPCFVDRLGSFDGNLAPGVRTLLLHPPSEGTTDIFEGSDRSELFVIFCEDAQGFEGDIPFNTAGA
jgi:superfamily II DNA/RNA helicase